MIDWGKQFDDAKADYDDKKSQELLRKKSEEDLARQEKKYQQLIDDAAIFMLEELHSKLRAGERPAVPEYSFTSNNRLKRIDKHYTYGYSEDGRVKSKTIYSDVFEKINEKLENTNYFVVYSSSDGAHPDVLLRKRD